ncbi:MAG TPA: type II toxin-antitoxin system Phd/YefM family antitoxin [Acidimicrobiales bacterium]|nr:type II toxin-antitoxin system Phd/YefM family antitoxin [Acidimicrobiales bacterium]
MSLSEVRNRLSEIVDSVDRTHDRVTITRRGRPVAVLLSLSDLDSLEETTDILASPGELEAIRAAAADVDRGDVVDWDDLRSEFGPTG